MTQLRPGIYVFFVFLISAFPAFSFAQDVEKKVRFDEAEFSVTRQDLSDVGLRISATILLQEPKENQIQCRYFYDVPEKFPLEQARRFTKNAQLIEGANPLCNEYEVSVTYFVEAIYFESKEDGPLYPVTGYHVDFKTFEKESSQVIDSTVSRTVGVNEIRAEAEAVERSRLNCISSALTL